MERVETGSTSRQTIVFLQFTKATVSRPAMHPKHLSISDFTYSLPEDRIAAYPLPDRDASRLLVYKNGIITEDRYKNIAAHLPANSLLIFNNSKVIEARLLFQKPSGGMIELFCLEPDERYPDIAAAMKQEGMVFWQCMVGGASKWKHGQVLEKRIAIPGSELILQASYREKKAGSFVIEFNWQPAHLSFAEVLHLAGAIPLPPYIRRKPETSDATRYQTVYAQHDGSVAAPTAGLHFTPAVFETLTAKNIDTGFVTLHVGAGTFKPVKSETMEAHEMHAEFIDVSRETIRQLIDHLGANIIAVGTTSLRTMESLYWLGVKKITGSQKVNSRKSVAAGTGVGGSEPEVDNRQSEALTLGQWEAYELEQGIAPGVALKALLDWMDQAQTDRLVAKTQILIAPGYTPRIARALVTNFHQPQSTLLLLIAALIGDQWKEVYQYALTHDFRFLSYGDGCLLWV